MNNLEVCTAERCEYNRSGYCGYFSVTGCQRPCKPGEKCDFFGGATSGKPPKPKKSTKAAAADKVPESPKPETKPKHVVIYANGAQAALKIRGDSIKQMDEWFLIFAGDILIGFVRVAEVYLIYVEEAT